MRDDLLALFLSRTSLEYLFPDYFPVIKTIVLFQRIRERERWRAACSRLIVRAAVGSVKQHSTGAIISRISVLELVFLCDGMDKDSSEITVRSGARIGIPLHDGRITARRASLICLIRSVNFSVGLVWRSKMVVHVQLIPSPVYFTFLGWNLLLSETKERVRSFFGVKRRRFSYKKRTSCEPF